MSVVDWLGIRRTQRRDTALILKFQMLAHASNSGNLRQADTWEIQAGLGYRMSEI